MPKDLVPLVVPKRVPRFFIYLEERGLMVTNDLVLNSLTYEEVEHLSDAERMFFKFYRENGALGLACYYCKDGPKFSQEEECQFFYSMLSFFVPICDEHVEACERGEANYGWVRINVYDKLPKFLASLPWGKYITTKERRKNNEIET